MWHWPSRPAAYDESDRLIAERFGLTLDELGECYADPAFQRRVHEVANQLTIERLKAHLVTRCQHAERRARSG